MPKSILYCQQCIFDTEKDHFKAFEIHRGKEKLKVTTVSLVSIRNYIERKLTQFNLGIQTLDSRVVKRNPKTFELLRVARIIFQKIQFSSLFC